MDSSSSSRLIVRRIDKGSHVFFVDNYSLCRGIGANMAVESKEFTVGGYRWIIRFYPDGIDSDVQRDGYISLFVSLDSGSIAPRTSEIFFDLHIADPSGECNHKSMSGLRYSTREGRLPCRGDMFGLRQFIKKKSLENGYIKNNYLKISCNVGVLDSDVQDLPIIRYPLSDIRGHFGTLLESKEGADVIFRVCGESFYGHCWILAARSPEFRALLSESKEKNVILDDIEPRVFKAMLWFIYTGYLLEDQQISQGPAILESFLGKMLEAAHRFELGSLKRICESRMVDGMCLESVAYVLHLAHRNNATQLKAACLDFAVDHLSDLEHLDGYRYLCENCPSVLSELYRNKEDPQAPLPPYVWKDTLVAIKENLAGFCRRQGLIGKKRKRE